MKRQQIIGLSVAAAVNTVCAAMFWAVFISAGDTRFFSFWNKPTSSRFGLTLAFVVIGSRILVWFVRKVWGYKLQRRRGMVRLAPLGFGLAVFSVTISWLAVTLLYSAIERSIRLILGHAQLDITVIFVPFFFFFQFLFSRSTLVWLLAGGVLWLVAAYLPTVRQRLIDFKVSPEMPDPAAETSLSFVKTWNVFGYLILILSLMYQG